MMGNAGFISSAVAFTSEDNVKAGVNKELAPLLKQHAEHMQASKAKEKLQNLLIPTIDTLSLPGQLELNLRSEATRHLRVRLCRGADHKVGTGSLLCRAGLVFRVLITEFLCFFLRCTALVSVSYPASLHLS